MKQEEKKEPSPKGIKKSTFAVSVILVALLSVIGTLIATDTIGSEKHTGQSNQTSMKQEPAEQTNFDALNEVYELLENNYYEEVEPEVLIEGAISGMADAVGDPYTEYLDEEESSSLNEDITGSFEGIGAEVMKEGKAVKIVSPISGSPAEKAGLLPNDLILSIDEESVEELSLNEAVALIRGPKGTEVTLSIQRGDRTFKVTLTRDSIPLETVKYNLDETDSSIGYVRITSFSSPTYDEMVSAIEDLRSQGATSFIFDVRGNPGGLLNIAIQMANVFVKEGETLLRVEERGEEPLVYTSNDALYGKFKVTEPSVLLINEGSASASEILAGAMNETADIPLVGTKSFGKGTIQNIKTLQTTGELKLTIGKWLTPNGNWVHEKGIQPTEEIELPDYVHLLMIDSDKTYKENDLSPEVENIEQILKALDYSTGEIDGLYDQETVKAVKHFQRDEKLEETGQVTGETALKLVEKLRELIEKNDTQYEAAKKTLLKNR